MAPTPRVSRREFLRLAAVGSAVLVTAACTALPAAPAASTGNEAAPPSGEGVTLRKMAWGSPLEKEAIEKGLATFMEQNPSIEVEYIHTPERYAEVLQTMLAAGNAPDVYKVGNFYPDIAVRGALMDITDLVSSDPVLGAPDYFFPFEAERSVVDGKWYAIGSTFQWRLIYYNKPALEEAGVTPPTTTPEEAWTWDQLLEAATALTVDGEGRHPGDAGFDVQNVQQWGLFFPDTFYDNYVFSNGGKILDGEPLQYTLDAPEAIEAVQRLADLRLVQQVAAQGAVLQDMGMNAWQMLATGRMAMIQDGNWALLDISQMGFEFGVGVLPMLQQPATVTGSSWTGIYADTAYPDESWQLLRYLNLDEYQAHLVRVGLWGVSHQTLLTPEGIKMWWDPDVHPENWLALEQDYKFNYGHVIPNTVGALRTTQMITQEMADVWTGARTAEELLTDLVPRLNQALEEERAAV
ncbi:MAG TPA: sugar ABC transporter substrate-binding protein [Caldilineaceae bacterium]|nr:sugar ABC transporter substrate-binding protein [Caldilineaceae bacterium]